MLHYYLFYMPFDFSASVCHFITDTTIVAAAKFRLLRHYFHCRYRHAAFVDFAAAIVGYHAISHFAAALRRLLPCAYG